MPIILYSAASCMDDLIRLAGEISWRIREDMAAGRTPGLEYYQRLGQCNGEYQTRYEYLDKVQRKLGIVFTCAVIHGRKNSPTG